MTWFVVALFVLHVVQGIAVETDCSALGFNKESLLCSNCDKLAEFIKDTSLQSECRQCCIDDSSDESNKVYPKAVLQVCQYRMEARETDVLNFVEKKARAFSNLEVKLVQGSRSTLFFQDKDSKILETKYIDGWKTDAIEEFLKTKLKH